MLDSPTQSLVMRRLDRIEARVGQIRLLIQQGTLCPDLLLDLASAQEALSILSTAVIKFHVRQCVQDTTAADAPARMAELVDIFDRFLR